jgi:hypothetical protein
MSNVFIIVQLHQLHTAGTLNAVLMKGKFHPITRLESQEQERVEV